MRRSPRSRITARLGCRPPRPDSPRAPAPASDPGHVVLYFDLPHLTPPGGARSVAAARRFLESTDLAVWKTMVLAYSAGDIRVLAPYTQDRARLLAALDGVLAKGSTMDDSSVARVNNIQAVAAEACTNVGGPPASAQPGGELSSTGSCPNQVSMARMFAKEEEARAKKSLEALRSTIAALGGETGRKSLVLFTETLRDEPGAYYLQMARTTPAAQDISIAPEFRRVVEEASGSSVAFYPVYAAGLEDASGDDIGRTSTSLGTLAQAQVSAQNGPNTPPQARRDVSASNRKAADMDTGPLQQAMKGAESGSMGFNASIAAETGGRALGWTNDLSKIFPIVRDEMACYYVLSYQPSGAADGKRHTIEVDVDQRKAKVRARQYFVDWTAEQRLDRRFATALDAPAAFRDLALTLEAFALGRAKGGRQVLVKASIPAEDLLKSASGVPPDDGSAIVRVRGRVSGASGDTCSFGAEFPIAQVKAAAAGKGSLRYEASCPVGTGPHEISAAVFEKRGGTMGGARRSVVVPLLTGFTVSEPQLWAAARADLVYREQAADIFGPSKGIAIGIAAPRSERRLIPGEKGSLMFLVCPPEKGWTGGDVTVARTILSGESPVATFPVLRLKGPPDPTSGCWGVTSEIPNGILGEGIYLFNYDVHAPGLAEPISRSAPFAVGAPAVSEPEGGAARPPP
ncbi:MAG: VWA domain-containing protein [Acidobacteria bacterium]|nr:VWA domain-containing protein [Acidobacteriota bacterium]